MKTAIRNAAFAIAAAALAPAAAHACELQPPGHVHVKVHAQPVLVHAEWNGRAGHDGRGPDWERGARDGGLQGWERGRWVEHQRAELRAAYARLDEARAHFYARPHRHWEVRKFERWYARERAELDARRQVLVAWR